MDINKIIVRGEVSDAPNIKRFNDGNEMAILTIKTVTPRSDGKSRTVFHRVTTAQQNAVAIASKMKVGDTVYAEGGFRTREFKDREGNMVKRTDIRATYLAPAPGGGHLNLSTIHGNLVGQPNVIGDNAGVRFTVATNKKWTTEGGQTNESTEWNSVVIFKEDMPDFDIMGYNRLDKGVRMSVCGPVVSNGYTDRNGVKQRSNSIYGSVYAFSSSGGEDGGESGAAPEQVKEDPWAGEPGF